MDQPPCSNQPPTDTSTCPPAARGFLRHSAVFSTAVLTFYALGIGALNAQSLYERSFNDTSASASAWRSFLTTVYPHIQLESTTAQQMPNADGTLMDNTTEHQNSATPSSDTSQKPALPDNPSHKQLPQDAHPPKNPLDPLAHKDVPTVTKSKDIPTLSDSANGSFEVPQKASAPTASTSATVISEPLRVMTIGDSLAQGYAMAWARLDLARLTQDSPLQGRKIQLLDFAQHSTGIANVRYKNWPATFEQLCTQKRPHLVIASFGANDLMGMYHQGATIAFGTDSWVQLYQTRLMDIAQSAKQCGAQLVLVVPPIVQKKDHEKMMTFVRQAHEQACQASSLCIRTDEVFSPQGTYTSSAPIDGKVQTVRAADGVHLTMSGYTYVAKKALEHLIQTQPK